MSKLVNELFEALGKTAGFSNNTTADRDRLRYLYEATKDDDIEDDDIEDEDEGGEVDDDDLDFVDDDDESGEVDDDLDFEDDKGDLDMDDDGLVDDEEFGSDYDSDFDLDDDSIDDSEDLDVDFGEFDMEDSEMATLDSLDSLSANEPPMDTFGGDKLDTSSDFSSFITNQLIDFPVDNVKFSEQDGAKYVDARFGEKDITFVLYNGEEGEPLIAMIHKESDREEVTRLELPPEAVEDGGTVKIEFMPVSWIRDNLARIIDTAPTFECYRLASMSRNCNEVYTLKKKKRTSLRMIEALKSEKCGNPLNKSSKGVGKAIKVKKTKPVSKASSNKVTGKKVVTSKVKLLNK